MKILKLAAIPVLALAASAFAFAPNAGAAVKPPVTCTTVTATTYKTVTTTVYKIVAVTTYKTVHHRQVAVVTKKSVPVVTMTRVPVITKTKVCTTTPPPVVTPPVVPTSIAIGSLTLSSTGVPGNIPAIIYGATGVLTWTDIDTNINGVRVWDNGPASFGPLPDGTDGTTYSAELIDQLAPGTYTLTIDIRSGATILATSAPVTVVVSG